MWFDIDNGIGVDCNGLDWTEIVTARNYSMLCCCCCSCCQVSRTFCSVSLFGSVHRSLHSLWAIFIRFLLNVLNGFAACGAFGIFPLGFALMICEMCGQVEGNGLSPTRG